MQEVGIGQQIGRVCSDEGPTVVKELSVRLNKQVSPLIIIMNLWNHTNRQLGGKRIYPYT